MAKNIKILHTQVGPFPKGWVVPTDHPLLKGADLSRLKKIHAVEETDEPITRDELPAGPENRTEPPPAEEVKVTK